MVGFDQLLNIDPASPRERIILAMIELLELQGYNATGLNEIVKRSQAPKGSIYHYFPDGKEGIAIAAIEWITDVMSGMLRQIFAQHDDAATAIRTLIESITAHFESSGNQKGSPIAIIALETSHTNENLRLACEQSFTKRHLLVKAKLIESGYSDAQADALANLVVSAFVGAIAVGRTRRDSKPLHDVAEFAYTTIKAIVPENA